MATLIVASLGIAAAAYLGRMGLQTYARRAQLKATEAAAMAAKEKFMHGFQFTPQQLAMLKDYSKTGFQPKMSHDEALRILGVTGALDKKKIIMAHRQLMMANHPDSGGSTYLASKINEARDILMKDLGS